MLGSECRKRVAIRDPDEKPILVKLVDSVARVARTQAAVFGDTDRRERSAK
jgi:hypothetical protein